MPASFRVPDGLSQGRPPVGCDFQRTGNAAAAVFRFADRHNKTGAWADPAMDGLHNSVVPLGGNCVSDAHYAIMADVAIAGF